MFHRLSQPITGDTGGVYTEEITCRSTYLSWRFSFEALILLLRSIQFDIHPSHIAWHFVREQHTEMI